MQESSQAGPKPANPGDHLLSMAVAMYHVGQDAGLPPPPVWPLTYQAHHGHASLGRPAQGGFRRLRVCVWGGGRHAEGGRVSTGAGSGVGLGAVTGTDRGCTQGGEARGAQIGFKLCVDGLC